MTARAAGATHGAEAAYVFENLLGNRPWTDLDRQLADTISSYWVNFAANGDPNGKGLREVARVRREEEPAIGSWR